MRPWLTTEANIVRQCAEEGLTQQRTSVVLAEAGFDRNRDSIARFALRNNIKFHGEAYKFGNNNRWKNHTKKGRNPEKRREADRRYRQKLLNGHKPLSRKRWLKLLYDRRNKRIQRKSQQASLQEASLQEASLQEGKRNDF